MTKKIESLLDLVQLLRDKHQIKKNDNFNIFTLLRSPTDEVNLHSKFIWALLNHNETRSHSNKNLTTFLNLIGWDTYSLNNIRVERERYNIDLLITNSIGQAVIIENKIHAADQPKQLERLLENN